MIDLLTRGLIHVQLFAQSAEAPCADDQSLCNPFPIKTADKSNIEAALHIVFVTTGAVAVLMVSYAGFKYVMSRGNPDETAKAKDTILYAIIGLLISVSAYSLVTLVAGRL